MLLLTHASELIGVHTGTPHTPMRTVSLLRDGTSIPLALGNESLLLRPQLASAGADKTLYFLTDGGRSLVGVDFATARVTARVAAPPPPLGAALAYIPSTSRVAVAGLSSASPPTLIVSAVDPSGVAERVLLANLTDEFIIASPIAALSPSDAGGTLWLPLTSGGALLLDVATRRVQLVAPCSTAGVTVGAAVVGGYDAGSHSFVALAPQGGGAFVVTSTSAIEGGCVVLHALKITGSLVHSVAAIDTASRTLFAFNSSGGEMASLLAINIDSGDVTAADMKAADVPTALFVTTLCVAPPPPTVVVYGSTPGGVIAAVAAARAGATVTLVDPSPRLGGMCSGGLGHTDVGLPFAIGGYAREFFVAVGVAYGATDGKPAFFFEPGVAERTFYKLLADANVTVVRTPPIASTQKSGGRISSLTTADGRMWGSPSTVFVDGTYEGDLARSAGVTTTYGREPAAQYGESWGGRNEPFGFPFDWRPFSPLDSDGNLLPLLTTRISAPRGAGDDHVQGYNYRLCVTRNTSNSLSFPLPRAYNASMWEVLRRLANLTAPSFTSFAAPGDITHGKADLNNGALISTDATGLGWGWPTATPAERLVIADEIKEYMLGFIHTLRTDPALPAALRASTAEWGLCADEFVSNGGWPEQVYVREASRVVGDRVLIQKDLWPNPTSWGLSSIGMGSYAADGHYSTCGPCIKDAALGDAGCRMVTSEEELQAARSNGTLYTGGEGYVGVTNHYALYQIPYSTLLPRRSEVTNLLTPLTPSASHVTFASLRVEPQFMILGHAAGDAAAIAAHAGIAVHDVPPAALRARLASEGAVLCDHGAPACV